jgi:peptidoglycan/LPS O-acetylase OafA/YrhL
MGERISYLDGLRGLAILLVILYHAYARWPEIVPYGGEYADFPLFATGWLGVNLFFMISGFVILMTLDKCETSGQFMYRRWLRLFPAMLICSLLIFFTASFFSERPQGSPTLRDLLPGLTFIEPKWWQYILGSQQGFLEGAFWSLYVEFKFYIIASLLYFWFGRKAPALILFGLFMATEFIDQVRSYQSVYVLNVMSYIFHKLDFNYFGWFAAGASFYIYTSSREMKWFYIAVAISLLSSVSVHQFYTISTVAAIVISLFFAASVISKKLQSLLSNWILLVLGFVSYPLYLLHENMMVSMIVKFGNYFPESLYFALPIIPVPLIVGLAYIVARYLESPLKKMIIKFFIFTGVVLNKLKSRVNIKMEG